VRLREREEGKKRTDVEVLREGELGGRRFVGSSDDTLRDGIAGASDDLFEAVGGDGRRGESRKT
jgi:hypothetical protein